MRRVAGDLAAGMIRPRLDNENGKSQVMHDWKSEPGASALVQTEETKKSLEGVVRLHCFLVGPYGTIKLLTGSDILVAE